MPKGVAHATPGQFLGFFSGIHVGIPKFQFVVKRICKFSFEKCITVVCSMFASIVSPITWSEPSFLLDAALLHCWAVAIYTGILGLVVRPSMLAYIAKRPTMNTVFYLYRWLQLQLRLQLLSIAIGLWTTHLCVCGKAVSQCSQSQSHAPVG